MKPQYIITALLLTVFTDPTHCQDFSTLEEIYNFDPGDEFEIIHLYCYNPTIAELESLRIEERQLHGDSLIYIRSSSMLTISHDIEPPVVYDTSYIDLHDMVVIYPVDSIIFDSGDSVYYDPDLFNGRKICIAYDWLLNAERVQKYAEGCGLVCTGWRNTPNSLCCVTDSLHYYKKGNEIWGQKILGTQQQLSGNDIIIFPNPANEFLQLKINKSLTNIFQISIFSSSGRCLKSIPQNFSNEKSIFIPIRYLENGIYFINFNTSRGNATLKFIKI